MRARRSAFLLPVLATGLAVALALASQCANRRRVFIPADHGAEGFVAFTDGDCYARMTRAREVFRHPGTVVREHRFENFPTGVHAHTTAPLDYAIAGLAWLWGALRPAAGENNALDLAGAWISPVFGAATLGFLAWWAWREAPAAGGWPAVVAVAAGSPILAHGFALGRPDHQSAELLCVAVGLASELTLWRRSSPAWAVAGGAGWGLGLWVSLYEPAVLLGLVLLAAALIQPAALRRRERWAELAVGGGILLAALACEGGGRLALPGFGGDPDAGLFAAWSRQIGELQGVAPWSPVLFRWCGWGLVAGPVALGLAWRAGRDGAEGRVARGWLGLLLAAWALTCWQLRWGYFLALIAAMSLPWQMLALAGRTRGVRWAVGAAWALGLLPLAGEFAGRVQRAWGTGDETALAELVRETREWRGAAEFLHREAGLDPAQTEGGGVLAPWWLSPALAYWSELPAVAGSSHESLPGTADAARFFLTPARDPAAARALLQKRRVRWIVVDDPERVLPTAADLLGRATVAADALGAVLTRFAERAPRGLRLAYANPAFKVYAVDPLVYAGGP